MMDILITELDAMGGCGYTTELFEEQIGSTIFRFLQEVPGGIVTKNQDNEWNSILLSGEYYGQSLQMEFSWRRTRLDGDFAENTRLKIRYTDVKQLKYTYDLIYKFRREYSNRHFLKYQKYGALEQIMRLMNGRA